MLLAVQRLRLPGPGVVSYTLVGADGLPVEPAEAFLSHLALTAVPNTVQAYAHDLQDFFTWLGQTGLDWHSLSLEQLALFFDWLRRPAAARAPGVFMLPGTAAALENSTLQRKRAALAGFYRFHARRDNRVPALLGELIGTRPTGQYTPMLVHTRRAGPAEYSPIRIHTHRKVPETLTAEEVGRGRVRAGRQGQRSWLRPPRRRSARSARGEHGGRAGPGSRTVARSARRGWSGYQGLGGAG